jgi:hypothetical protein
MNIRNLRLLKRCAAGLLLAAGLGGCAVYGPPYAGYDPYYGNTGYSGYYGSPVEVNLGLGYYSGGRRGDYRDGRGHGRPYHDRGRGRGRDRH